MYVSGLNVREHDFLVPNLPWVILDGGSLPRYDEGPDTYRWCIVAHRQMAFSRVAYVRKEDNR